MTRSRRTFTAQEEAAVVKRYPVDKMSSVYRVLRDAGVMGRFNGKKSKKGTGFGPSIVANGYLSLSRYR
jgi:hypothetical protein